MQQRTEIPKYLKNGFHSVEHALIRYIHSKTISRESLDLYFAVAAEDIYSFIARPYLFTGEELNREDMGVIGSDDLYKVKVTFQNIQ